MCQSSGFEWVWIGYIKGPLKTIQLAGCETAGLDRVGGWVGGDENGKLDQYPKMYQKNLIGSMEMRNDCTWSLKSCMIRKSDPSKFIFQSTKENVYFSSFLITTQSLYYSFTYQF